MRMTSSHRGMTDRCSRQGAFSILELLVVIGIMAVLAAMTMAIAPGFLRSSAMSSSLSSVASAVSLARNEAIRSRKQTYFVLAPTNSEKGFLAYAILRREDGTNSYVVPWKKLPTGVLFRPDVAPNPLPSDNFPYPGDGGASAEMRVISFVSDGALDDGIHLPENKKPVLPLQVGTRTGTGEPTYQGDYITNQIVVERMSGKVKVERQGEVTK